MDDRSLRVKKLKQEIFILKDGLSRLQGQRGFTERNEITVNNEIDRKEKQLKVLQVEKISKMNDRSERK